MTWATTKKVDVFASFAGEDGGEVWVLLSGFDLVQQVPKGTPPLKDREITRVHMKSGEVVFLRHTTAEFWKKFQEALRQVGDV